MIAYIIPTDGALHKLDCPQFLTTHQAVDRQWIQPRVIIIHAMWRSYYGMNMKGKVDCYMMYQRSFAKRQYSVKWHTTLGAYVGYIFCFIYLGILILMWHFVDGNGKVGTVRSPGTLNGLASRLATAVARAAARVV